MFIVVHVPVGKISHHFLSFCWVAGITGSEQKSPTEGTDCIHIQNTVDFSTLCKSEKKKFVEGLKLEEGDVKTIS